MNQVKIGNSNIQNGLLAVQAATAKNKEDIEIIARGNAISKAVDTALISQDRYGFKIKKIETGTEAIKTKENKEMNVSSIEITIGKEKK